MVVRILRFRLPARHGQRVFDHARRLVGPDRPDGLLHVAVGRQQEGPNDTFAVVTEWRDLEAIYRWVGRPELLSATPSLGVLAEFATEIDVQHYEGPDRTVDEGSAPSLETGFAPASLTGGEALGA